MQTATEVLVVKHAVIKATRKRKVSEAPPFQWKHFPGMKVAFAELVRDRRYFLEAQAGDTTHLYAEIARLLENEFQAKAFIGREGILRLRQEYRNMKRDCGNFVKKHSFPGNGRFAISRGNQPKRYSPGRACPTGQRS